MFKHQMENLPRNVEAAKERQTLQLMVIKQPHNEYIACVSTHIWLYSAVDENK